MTPREKTNTIKKKAKKPEESMDNEECTYNGVRISDMIHSTLGALLETWSFDYVYLEISLSWEVVRILPYSAVQQFAYESYKKLYAGKDGELSVSGRLAADASAGMTSTFCYHIPKPPHLLLPLLNSLIRSQNFIQIQIKSELREYELMFC
ncbi:hypothetical protein L2E82_47606 [Cichorium intybus]|uniref:Uncharacterized protein n=1 Tax=Cichorium intybus TaxID=13427 RepID=A0ACB8YVS6_CICIN|nr:hypothetical protein L2E82_47606 [Cichorium intybus]